MFIRYRLWMLLGVFFQSMGIESTGYRLIWEKRFDREVERAIFVTENGKFYPKAIIFKDEVLCIAPEGKVKTRIPYKPYGPGPEKDAFTYSNVEVSPNGEYIGIETFVTRDYDKIIKESLFRLYNKDGKLLWQTSKPLHGADEEYQLALSSKGILVVNRFEYGGIDLYQPDGTRRILTPFGIIGWGRRTFVVKWSENEERLAVVAEKKPLKRYKELKPAFSSEPWLILYDSKGNEIWRRALDEYLGGRVIISPHGKYLLAACITMKGIGKGVHSTSVYLFNEKGNLINRFKNTDIRLPLLQPLASFSSDDKLLALATVWLRKAKSDFWLIDLSNGKVLLQKEFKDRIDRVVMEPLGKFFAVEVRPEVTGHNLETPVDQRPLSYYTPEAKRKRLEYLALHDDALIYVYDIKGKLLNKIHIKGAETPTHTKGPTSPLIGYYRSLPVLQNVSVRFKKVGLVLEKKVSKVKIKIGGEK